MKRFLLTLLALVLAAPALAQSGEGEPEWVGVWQGTIGKHAVVACLDTGYSGGGRGSYYYRRHLRPIPLRLEADETRWTEQPMGEESAAGWTLTSVAEKQLKGTWSDGRRRLPVSLEAIEWQDPATPYMPCEAPAFIEPRLEGGEVVIEAGDLGGIAYLKHEYRNPPHLEVTVSGFAIFEEQPGDAAINEALAPLVPTGKAEDDWVECLSGALAAYGWDGDFYRLAGPTLLDDAYVTARIATSLYCGGAHPSHWTEHRVFDRKSGEQIDLLAWLGESAIHRNDYGSVELSEAFVGFITDNWGGIEPECAAESRSFGFWDIELRSEGLGFTPSLPHVMAACAEQTVLDWSQLSPWLGDIGRAGLARLAKPAG